MDENPTMQMVRRIALPLLIGALVVLAGCAGGLDTTPTGETDATDVSTPTEEQPTFAEKFMNGDGTLKDEVGNDDLGDVHHAGSVQNLDSYSFRLTDVTHNPETGETKTYTERYQSDGASALFERHSRNVDAMQIQYLDSTSDRRFIRNKEYGEVKETFETELDSIHRTGHAWLGGSLDITVFEFDGYTEMNGETVAEFTATGVDDRATDEFEIESVGSVEGSMFIDEHGIVHEATIEMTNGDGETVWTHDFRISNIGTATVEEPDWTLDA